MRQVKLTEAGVADIEVIRGLAERTWNQHYLSIISQGQIDYMLNLMYSASSLIEQLQLKQHRFFLIQVDEFSVGFISLHHEGDGNWFIHKFYIDQDAAGKGIGARVFNLIIEMFGPRQLKLTVNRQNFKAINFYFKCGFKIDHVADFDIGQGYVMNDFVMLWQH